MTTRFAGMQRAVNVAMYNYCQANAVQLATSADEDTPLTGPRVIAFVLLANTQQADLFFTERVPGILQIDVEAPQNWEKERILDEVDKLNAVFKTGSTLTFDNVCVTITGVSCGPFYTRNGWGGYHVSIDIDYYGPRL